MNLRTEFFLAWRYLKPKRNAVSVITCISVVGVTLGVAVLIVVLAVMTGFTDLMKNKILETSAHFQVQPPYEGSYIKKPKPIVKTIEGSGGRAVPVTASPILIQNDKRFIAKFVIGIDPDLKPGTIDLKRAVEKNGIGKLSPEEFKKAANSWESLENGVWKKTQDRGKFSLESGEVVLSYVIANELNVRVGDKILIHSPSRISKLVKSKEGGGVELDENAKMYLPEEYTVSGIFKFNYYKFDEIFLFMNRRDANELLDLPWGAATAVYGWTNDPFDMEPVIKKVKEDFPYYYVITWQRMNRRLMEVLAVEKTMMFFLMGIIVLVAAFSICNTLITLVINKTREIGLLKSIGASSFAVMRIFIMQGFLVGFIGTICGNAFGFAVVYWRNEIMKGTSELFGIELFPRQLYYFDSLPARIEVMDVLIIALLSMVLCTLGGIIPAWRASRLDAARALRYE